MINSTGRHHSIGADVTPDLYRSIEQAYDWMPSADWRITVRVPVAMWSRGPRHARAVSLVKRDAPCRVHGIRRCTICLPV